MVNRILVRFPGEYISGSGGRNLLVKSMRTRMISALLAAAALATASRPWGPSRRRPKRKPARSASSGWSNSWATRTISSASGRRTSWSALGFDAFDALNEAVDNQDVEIATRARSLLRQMQIQWSRKDDPPRVKQLLNDYESLDAEARQARMQSLVALPEGTASPRCAGWCGWRSRSCCQSRRPWPCWGA